MEWNAKSPTQWDWENLIMVNATTGNLKKSRAADWEIDGGEKRFSSWSFNSSGDGICNDSAGSGSGTGHASLSKSSQSASINFSSTGEVKTSKFTSETVAEDLNNEKELVKSRPTGGSRKLEASGEPLLGLKLGKRTYFGDVCAGSNAKTHPFSATPASSVIPAKRSKSSSQAMNVPRCQVEGCNIDLSMAKDYHRKHRICESHSKCSMVIVAGVERRFCQQCSRFHGLSEFDEKKRSCRRRLSDHNARRRKPQPGSFQLNPARLSSSLRDERGQMNFVWNRTPLVHSSPNANFVWESTPNSTFTITKEYVKPAKNEVVDEQLHLPGNQITNSVPMLHSNSNGSLPSKRNSTAAEALNQAFEEPVVISSNMDATPDLHRALSLLSTNRWGSYKPNSVSLQHPLHRYHTSTPQSALHTIPQGSALALSEYQRTEQQSANDTQMHNLTSHSEGSSYFQEF